MRIVYGLMGIVILAVVGWMSLSDYLLLLETKHARVLTVEEVKQLGVHGLPRYFVLKDAVRKNLASVESSLRQKGDGKNAMTDILYPVYGKREATDTSFDATAKNYAVVFLTETIKTDTSIHVFELFQPVSYRVRNTGALLTQDERSLFDDQGILVSDKAFKLSRDYSVPRELPLVMALICFAGIVFLGWWTIHPTCRQA